MNQSIFFANLWYDDAMKVSGILDEVKRVSNQTDLDSLILFVTNACNLSCGFCCYADNLNVSKDISLENMKKISESMGAFRALLISGGEPFIRADLDEILLTFSKNNQISSIYIPTNGWFLEKTAKTCESFLNQNKEVMLNLSFSVDGLEETHNSIRGKKETFDRLCKTIEFLSPWREKYPNLRLRVNSVVTPDNIGGIRPTIDYFFEHFTLDEHALEIVRDLSMIGAHHDSTARQKIAGEYLELVDYAYNLYAEGRESRRGQLGYLPESISNTLTYAYSRAMGQVKYDRIHGKLWSFPCTAGRKILVINGSGSLRACEHRGEVVDLRQCDFNVKEALKTGLMSREMEKIGKDKCDCIHGCFVGNSIQFSPKAILTKVLPRAIDYMSHSGHD
jgi:MoaA/NifB/PqqE/SkfB family radical SAM enzyme